MNIRYFYILFLLVISIHQAKAQTDGYYNIAGTYRPANMIVVEGGTIPMWSASNFEKQLAEFKEDPISGPFFKNPNFSTNDLKKMSRSAFQGEKTKTFVIADIETTLGEWKRVLEWAKKNGYKNLDDTGSGSSDNHPVRVTYLNAMIWCNAKSEMEGFKPVYKIKNQVYREGPETENSVYPKMVYFPDIDLKANGYRFPTQIEWEWAAIGGTNSKGYFFSGSNKPSEVAWHDWNTENTIEALSYTCPPPYAWKKYEHLSLSEIGKSWPEGTMPVALKKPNELGLYDMSGNIAEMCNQGVPRGGYFHGTLQTPCQWGTPKKPFETSLERKFNTIPYFKDKNSYSVRFQGFRLAQTYQSEI